MRNPLAVAGLSVLVICKQVFVAAAQQPDSPGEASSVCGSGQWITYVVDDDAFRLRGERIRMAAKEEDRFGRKLRIACRDRRSVGDFLVAEGLARRWKGSRGSWRE